MQYLLDTNTCINVMRNNPIVVSRVSAVAPGDCAVSAITSYELYTGVAKCALPAKERSKVELFLKTMIELSFDQAAAREAGRIRGLLESQGNVIGPYDILLAAQALALNLTLVTGNTNEFQRVPGLLVENWQVS